MLDLEPGVHLEEPEAAVRVEQELDGRRVDEPGRLGGADRGGVELAALDLVEARRRRLLDELLVAALERAVTLAEGDDVTVGVADELDLDVTGRPDLALQVDGAVAERRAGLGRSGRQGRGQLVGRRDPAHAPSPATGGRLDQQREPDRRRLGDDRRDLIRPVDRRRIQRPRHDRDARIARSATRRELVAEGRDRSRSSAR